MVFQIPNNWIKGHQTRIKNSGSLEKSYKKQKEIFRQTCINRYGVENPVKCVDVRNKIKQTVENTFQEKYGVYCYWMLPDAKKSNGSVFSTANNSFASLLEKNNILFEREFKLAHYSYDFKVGNTLIEIDPSATHNST